MQETRVRSLGWEDPLKKEMAAHSSILAWRIPWAEEPGGLQLMGVAKSRTQLKQLSMHTHLQGRQGSRGCIPGSPGESGLVSRGGQGQNTERSAGKESACNAGDLDSIPGLGRSTGEGNGNLLQYYCLENPMDKGA